MIDQEGLSSWVDATSLNSVLSGVAIMLMAWMATLMLAKLWQQSLAEDAHAAIERAASLGLVLRPTGFRSRLVARGVWAGTDALIVWAGGFLGERSVVCVGDRVLRLSLVTDPEQLEEALHELARQRAQEQADSGA